MWVVLVAGFLFVATLLFRWRAVKTMVEAILVTKCTRPTSPIELIGAYGPGTAPLWPGANPHDPQGLCGGGGNGGGRSRSERLLDQGMMHLFGFNYEEARHNFKAALQMTGQDDCRLCTFGLAATYQPHINSPLSEEKVKSGREIVKNRLSVSGKICPAERHLLEAQLTLFDPETWNTTATSRYSAALGRLVEEYGGRKSAPPLLQILHAESIMNNSPWSYFEQQSQSGNATTGGVMRELIVPAFQTLEAIIFGEAPVLHPLALHLFIHIAEQSNELAATQGMQAADHLARVMNGTFAGHLVHMPAHIFTRVGLYAKSIASSVAAVAVDKLYTARCLQPYVSHHNTALLVMAALHAADLKTALRHTVPVLETDPLIATYLTALFPMPMELVLARFGKWDALKKVAAGQRGDELRRRRGMALPAFLRALLVYAHSLVAIHSTFSLPSSSEALWRSAAADMSEAARGIAPDELPKDHVFYPNHVELGIIMNATIHAAVASKLGRFGEAANLIRGAVVVQDAFHYMEPENWYLPMRQCLAAVLLKAGKRHEAMAQLEEDVLQHPNSPWSKGVCCEVVSCG